jgi:hypothetical protein
MQAFSGKIDKHILRKMAEYGRKMTKNAEDFSIQDTTNDEEDLSAIKIAPKRKTKEEISLAESLGADSLFPESGSKKKVTVASDHPEVKEKDGVTYTKPQSLKEKKVKVEESIADGKGQKSTVKTPSPKVPRSDATMGKETKLPPEGVSIPTKGKDIDVSSLGISDVEAKEGSKMKKQSYAEQETMKRKDDKVENPDETSGETALEEKNLQEKPLDEMDHICESTDVEIPCRGEGSTIGNEEPAATDGPKVPRGDARMGNECPPDAQSPKIPTEIADTEVSFQGKTSVEAERQKQMDKISSVRREHAMRFAGQLIERGVLKEDAVDGFVSDMSNLPLDRMKSHVAMLMASGNSERRMMTASVALTTPIVKESELIVEKEGPTFTEQLAGMFTIAGPKNDKYIRKAIAEDQ